MHHEKEKVWEPVVEDKLSHTAYMENYKIPKDKLTRLYSSTVFDSRETRGFVHSKTHQEYNYTNGLNMVFQFI